MLKMYSGLMIIFAILVSFSSAAYGLDLPFPYGDQKGYCSQARIEQIIKDTVTNATANYKGLCAGVIRLHFHDCFVRGCDGSVLLNNPGAERNASSNRNLRGFEVIDAAKAAVVKSCAKDDTDFVVSCADILAFAARDCVEILGGVRYIVSRGRLDGKVSKAEEAEANLPPSTYNLDQLVKRFDEKGLNKTDLMVLTGAHSIGVAHCYSFKDRYDQNTNNLDQIDGGYKDYLYGKCMNDESVIVPQDETPDNLDSLWYKNGQSNKVLFFSDWVLRTDPDLNTLMELFAKDLTGSLWRLMFALSMEKMGKISDDRSKGSGGEIRQFCSAVNTQY